MREKAANPPSLACPDPGGVGVRGPLCHGPVGRCAGDGADPGHIDLLRDPRLRPRRRDIARWIRTRIDESPSVPRAP